MARIMMWVAQNGFRDEELFIPQTIFEENGHIVQVVSHQTGNAKSKFGKEISVVGLDSTAVQDYDAFLLVGGPGSMDYLNDGLLHSCIRSAFDAKIHIGAICFAPNILAKTGILNGINATVWGDNNILKEAGANCINDDVVASGKIITANGPDAAKNWANAIVKSISST